MQGFCVLNRVRQSTGVGNILTKRDRDAIQDE